MPNPTTPTPTCRHCNQPMQPGFVPDQGDGGVTFQTRWCAGEPERPWLMGEVKRKQWEAGYPIGAFRCPKCGLLESYALPQP